MPRLRKCDPQPDGRPAFELLLPALPALSLDAAIRRQVVPSARPARVKRDRIFQAVVTPEQFLANDHRWSAEDTVHHGPLILLTQALLVLRGPALDHFARRLTDRGKNLRDGFGARDFAVLAKVGAKDRAYEARTPGLFCRHTGDARGQEATSRKLARAAKRNFVFFAQALHVAPHVLALQRIEIERRVAPSLGCEHLGPEETDAIV